jgi:hypothetical protein
MTSSIEVGARPAILVVGDDRDLLETLAEHFGLPSPGGYEVSSDSSPPRGPRRRKYVTRPRGG